MIINFSIYALIGVLNTTIHWVVFYIFYLLHLEQSFCNLLAFVCAASFSYILNSKYNFKIKLKRKKYSYFLIIMGMINYLIGLSSENLELPPLFTLVISSFLSLFLGFIVSNFFIFR